MISFPKPDIEQFFQAYTILNFAISKDEKKLIFSSNLNGKFNLWALDLPNNYPYPLSFNNQMSNFIKIDSHNRFVLTSFDNDGDENFHIYALPVNGGKPVPVLTGNKHKYYFAKLTADGERLYYTTSKDNPNYLNIHSYNLKTEVDTVLIKGQETIIELLDVSPDEKSFAYIKEYSNTYAVGYIRTGQEEIRLTPQNEKEHNLTDFIFADNYLGYFITNFDDNFSYLASFNMKSGEFKPLLKIKQESIKHIKWQKTEKAIYIVTEKGVSDFLYRYDVNSETLTKIKTPVASIEQLEVTENGNIYLLGHHSTNPLNIFQRTSEGWFNITNNRLLGISENEMVAPEVVYYNSYDNIQIEALLYRAKPEVDNGYTIFWPHGGPQEVERISFKGLFQYLLAYGYSIFAPNFRGSSGYGASFSKMVEGDWGKGPRLDCIYGIEWLFKEYISERDKLFVLGGSYGGYMALLLAGKHPEYFRAVIDIFGPSNLFTFVDSIPEHWKPIIKRLIGDPVKDKEKLTKDSPITYLENMTKPMLVIQGANDPRVVKAESDQIVAELKKRKVDVEYLVLEDEGHGLSKLENKIKVYRLILDFLERHR